jgi:hypothetical protein
MTAYTVIIDKFAGMRREFHFTALTEEERDTIIISYMNTACAKFSDTCRQDLSKRNQEDTAFEADLTDDEIDIICNYMMCEWMKPYLYSSELLRERLSTRDYNQYSPANLIDKMNVLYKDTVKKSRLLAVNYSYAHRNYKDKLRDVISS